MYKVPYGTAFTGKKKKKLLKTLELSVNKNSHVGVSQRLSDIGTENEKKKKTGKRVNHIFSSPFKDSPVAETAGASGRASVLLCFFHT